MALRATLPIIGHIQIASIPSRHEPDGEELSYPFLFAELDRIGYEGYVGCEYNPRAGTLQGLGWFAPFALRPMGVRRSELMAIALGCIADDYTGASDLANTLSKAGLRTVQTIGVPDDLALPDMDAVVVALKSRSIEAAKAVALSRAADQWLRAHGASHVLFKICSTFDSTDAGNIGPVTNALVADADEAIVLVTPAFPETGRTVYQGNLFVGAAPRTKAREVIGSSGSRRQSRARTRATEPQQGRPRDLFTVVEGPEFHPGAAEGARGIRHPRRDRGRRIRA